MARKHTAECDLCGNEEKMRGPLTLPLKWMVLGNKDVCAKCVDELTKQASFRKKKT